MSENKNQSLKDKRIDYAKQHTEYMANKYAQEIDTCIKNTMLYENSVDVSVNNDVSLKPRIFVKDEDSVTALFNNKGKKTCVLNFASYKHPGGGFLYGSIAQEECLCMESFLYNVLSQLPDFYEWNSKHLNNSLYLNRALYSPNVVFEHDNFIGRFDVLTCASPNMSGAKNKVTVDENSKALRDRIQFIIDIINKNNVDTAILGAFGCGVFAQNPTEVATIFNDIINNTHFNKPISIVFAIPKGKNINLKSFKEVFE